MDTTAFSPFETTLPEDEALPLLRQALAGADDGAVESIGRFAETLGVGFQIQDDIMNLTEDSNKGQFVQGYIGSDITEGKRTLMVIHALANMEEEKKSRLLKILSMHTDNKEIITEAIDLLKEAGSVDYAKEKARTIVKDSWSIADPVIPDNEAKMKIKAFADFLVNRDI